MAIIDFNFQFSKMKLSYISTSILKKKKNVTSCIAVVPQNKKKPTKNELNWPLLIVTARVVLFKTGAAAIVNREGMHAADAHSWKNFPIEF